MAKKKQPDESLYEAYALVHWANPNDPKLAKEREAAEERLRKHMYELMNHGSIYSRFIGVRISKGKHLAKLRRLQEQQAENGSKTRRDGVAAKGGKGNGKKEN